MLDYRKNEIIIVEGLKDYLSTELRPFELVRQNQIAQIPSYPYGSYTVTTPIHEQGGTFSRSNDGAYYRAALQTWGITIQSDDQEEALSLAFRAYDYFRLAGVTYLADQGITVRRVRDITARDNLLTSQYEYRNGLDVTFGLLYVISTDNQINTDEIETIDIKEE